MNRSQHGTILTVIVPCDGAPFQETQHLSSVQDGWEHFEFISCQQELVSRFGCGVSSPNEHFVYYRPCSQILVKYVST